MGPAGEITQHRAFDKGFNLVIDIGLNQATDEDGNSHIVGDADTGAVADIASWTTPVPGGVAPVTVAMLMRNAAIAFEKQIGLGWV